MLLLTIPLHERAVFAISQRFTGAQSPPAIINIVPWVCASGIILVVGVPSESWNVSGPVKVGRPALRNKGLTKL